jgi:hypothetical protein
MPIASVVSTNLKKMKKNTIILVCLVLLSCKEKVRKLDLNAPTEENIEQFDSTYYFQLRDAYAKMDTSILLDYFDKWDKKSSELNSQYSDSLSRIISKIFTEIYHPFDVEKYGWLPRLRSIKYKYAVLPTEIKYKVIDEINKPDTIYKIKLDTLRQFYARPEIGKVIRLYDIEPFKTSMTIFLKTDSYKKTRFLESFIDTPISRNWEKYQTSPEILGLLLNRQLNIAVVDIRLISTGLRIYLKLENGKWKTGKIEQLWEE